MEIIRVYFNDTKGIPPSGLCVGVHRALSSAISN